MESLKKLSEATNAGEEKRENLHGAMSLLMIEWQDAEGQLKLALDIIRECLGEIESKEKHLRVVEESVKQGCEQDFDSRRRLIESGLKRLDLKWAFVDGFLKKIETEKMKFGEMAESLGKQMEDLLLMEAEIQGALKLKQGQVERRQMELDLMEAALRIREEKIISKEENLNSTERNLERRRNEIDSEEEKLNRRSKDLDVKERDLKERENELNLKAESLIRMDNEMKLRAEKLMLKFSEEIEAKSGMLETLKLELFSMKNIFQQSTREAEELRPSKSAEFRNAGRKRNCPAGEERIMEEINSKQAKGSTFIHRGRKGQVKARDVKKSDIQTTP